MDQKTTFNETALKALEAEKHRLAYEYVRVVHSSNMSYKHPDALKFFADVLKLGDTCKGDGVMDYIKDHVEEMNIDPNRVYDKSEHYLS